MSGFCSCCNGDPDAVCAACGEHCQNAKTAGTSQKVAPANAATVDRVATVVHRALLAANLRIVVKTGGGSDWGEFGTYDDQLLALVRELMRVGLMPVPSDQVIRAALTPDASSRWVLIDDVGGYVCGKCGTPTESEPCSEHQPREYARIGVSS